MDDLDPSVVAHLVACHGEEGARMLQRLRISIARQRGYPPGMLPPISEALKVLEDMRSTPSLWGRISPRTGGPE